MLIEICVHLIRVNPRHKSTFILPEAAELEAGKR